MRETLRLTCWSKNSSRIAGCESPGVSPGVTYGELNLKEKNAISVGEFKEIGIFVVDTDIGLKSQSWSTKVKDEKIIVFK